MGGGVGRVLNVEGKEDEEELGFCVVGRLC